jgi:RNA polymerase sigma factor (sigma-70 family)
MQELDDHSLLREYAENHSEEAFAALVTRHINKVYSAALRHTRNPSEAEEITQAVFVILAKKARRLGRKVVVSGWLYQTARLASVTYLRSEIRRARREQEAHTMQSILNEPDETWTQMAPLLDTAMAGLNETDRHAVVLRFFDGKSLREVGAALGATEDAAKKRLSRALEKLQRFFVKRGVVSTTAIIAGAISTNSVQAAPLALAKSVTVVAMAQGATASASTLTLVKGALKVMAWTKMKTAVVAGVVILLVAGTTTIHIYIHQANRHRLNPNDFWATSYPTPDYDAGSHGDMLSRSFPITPIRRCSISGLLDECMDASGWQYLIDKNVADGSVEFGNSKVMNGEEWVAAFENALQNGKPEWFDHGKDRKENLVLIRYPERKIVLVVPKEEAAKY